MEGYKEKISEILEVEDVNEEDEFESFECWDSLTVLSIIAMADESYDVQLSGEDVKCAKTIGELRELIESRMTNKCI
jgi:acyl carrier protein